MFKIFIICVIILKTIIMGKYMIYKNLFDSHIHSIHSFDGNHDVLDMCDSAIENGAIGVCFTDHCDIEMKDFEPRAFAEKAFNDIERAKTKFEGKLKVLNGIELGQGIYRKELSTEIINKYNYDFVIGSIHNLENMEDFYFLDYKKYNIYELLTNYFEDLLRLVQWNKCDTLAHLTYPLRYIVAREHIDIDMAKFDDVIVAIFEKLIRNDKALELNVSGLFMDMNDTLPNKRYIKLYRELGGKLITVGSDSHYKNKICQGIDNGYDILKECGYNEFTIFEQRKPKLIPIV